MVTKIGEPTRSADMQANMRTIVIRRNSSGTVIDRAELSTMANIVGVDTDRALRALRIGRFLNLRDGGHVQVDPNQTRPSKLFTMTYVTDGKCHNVEPRTFNHECGKPSTWVGVRRDRMFKSGFCNHCKEHGHEAKGYDLWFRSVDQYGHPDFRATTA